MHKNYYDILGVNKDSTQEQIKKAYRFLANKYHPDKCPDDPEAEAMFKEVAEAYSCLGDDSNRLSYDKGAYNGRKKQTLEERAQILLTEAFAQSLANLNENQIKNMNLVNFMKEKINDAIRILKQEMVKLESEKRKYIEARDRITGTNNLLYDVANANINSLETESEFANEQLQEMLAALVLLDGYHYNVDEVDMSHGIQISMFTNHDNFNPQEYFT